MTLPCVAAEKKTRPASDFVLDKEDATQIQPRSHDGKTQTIARDQIATIPHRVLHCVSKASGALKPKTCAEN